jgi:hypothetical protein
VVGDPPSAEHPRGTLAVVASQELLLIIDLATLTEIGRVSIGPIERDSRSVLARASAGLVMAVEYHDAIDVIWLDRGPAIRSRHRVPKKIPPGHWISLQGLGAIENRLVLVVDDNDFAGNIRIVAIVLDAEARVVAKHVCRGGLYQPSPPVPVEVWGHRGVLTVLTDDSDISKPVACAFGLDARAATQTASFPSGSFLVVKDGTLLLDTEAREGRREAHRIGDDLHPTGPALDPSLAEPPDPPKCTGITGTVTWQREMVAGLLVTRTVSCCGDLAPAGLWVCDPAAKQPHRGWP